MKGSLVTEADAVEAARWFAGFDDDVHLDPSVGECYDSPLDMTTFYRVELTSDIVVFVDAQTGACTFAGEH